MNKKIIGKKLRELRGKETIKSVAAAVGISYSALAMYERGSRIPRDEIKIKLANYFNVSVETIFFV